MGNKKEAQNKRSIVSYQVTQPVLAIEARKEIIRVPTINKLNIIYNKQYIRI